MTQTCIIYIYMCGWEAAKKKKEADADVKSWGTYHPSLRVAGVCVYRKCVLLLL